LAYSVTDAKVDLGSISLKALLQLAYKVEPYQVSGPEWMAATRFDILAKLPEGSTKEKVPEMLQAVLTDRFGLALHRESREMSVYALVTGKDGPKMPEGAADNSHPDMAAFMNGRRLLTRMSTDDGFWTITLVDSHRMFDAPRITMPEFARTLMPYVNGDPVVDMTGLKGAWTVSLEVPVPARPQGPINGAAAPAGVASDPEGGVSIFASVQKLGLLLEKRKAPVEHLIVDHVEKTPKEN
jgi:uncharacterized protein (TIGR03435 family)